MVLGNLKAAYMALYMDVGVGMALHKVSVACKVDGRVFGVDEVLCRALKVCMAYHNLAHGTLHHHDMGVLVWKDSLVYVGGAYGCNLCCLQTGHPYQTFYTGNLVYLESAVLRVLLQLQRQDQQYQPSQRCLLPHC